MLNIFKKTFPDFNNYFAVKATPNPHILKILIGLGMGLDCSSKVELEIAEKLRIPSEKIIFTSNYTCKEDLLKAAQMKVIINLDDVSLVNNLKEVCNDNNIDFPDFLFFRVNPGIGTTSSETVSNI